MKTALYDGKVVITTTFRNFGSDTDARRVLELVKSAIPLTTAEEQEVAVFSLVLANTHSIEFDLDGATEEIVSWSRYWDWLNTNIVLDRDADEGYIVRLSSEPSAYMNLWLKYRRMVGNIVAKEWYDAFEKAQVIYPARLEMAKEENIPPELAHDPDFLGEGEKPVSASEIDASPI